MPVDIPTLDGALDELYRDHERATGDELWQAVSRVPLTRDQLEAVKGIPERSYTREEAEEVLRACGCVETAGMRSSWPERRRRAPYHMPERRR